VGVEAIGEEVGDVFLQEPNHGVLLPQYGRHPRTDAFERVLAASVVQETKDWLAQSKNRSRFSRSSQINATKSSRTWRRKPALSNNEKRKKNLAQETNKTKEPE